MPPVGSRASLNPANQDAVTLLRDLARQYPKSRYAAIIRARIDALDEHEKQKKDKDKDKNKDKNKDKPHDDD